MQPWKKKTQKIWRKDLGWDYEKYKLKIPSEKHNKKTAETWANEFEFSDRRPLEKWSEYQEEDSALLPVSRNEESAAWSCIWKKKSRFGNTYCYIMLHDVTINYTCDQLLSSTLPRSVPTSLPTSKPLRNHAGWVIHDQLCARSILAWYGHNSGEIHSGSSR